LKIIFQHFIIKYIDWKFRKRSPFLIVFTASAFLLGALVGIGGLFGKISYQGYVFQISQSDTAAASVINFLIVLLTAALGLSLIVLIIEFAIERISASKRKHFVIEGRGLRDDDGLSLSKSIGTTLFFKSRIVPYTLDLRQGADGKIKEPELLIPKISAVKESVNQARAGSGKENLDVYYGGLTAVPLTFLTGVELDDEGTILVYDWDRTSERWRALDGLDDGLRLEEPDLDAISLSKNIVLAVSVSYPVIDTDLSTSFKIPVVSVKLDGMSSSSHWSADKQAALADQFFETTKKLSALGVEHIHLVLAAPNSVVFNFGRRYDKRNLPDITVYQYERLLKTKYPWGVRMPVGETESACVEYITQAIID